MGTPPGTPPGGGSRGGPRGGPRAAPRKCAHFGGYLITLPVGTKWDTFRDPDFGHFWGSGGTPPGVLDYYMEPPPKPPFRGGPGGPPGAPPGPVPGGGNSGGEIPRARRGGAGGARGPPWDPSGGGQNEAQNDPQNDPQNHPPDRSCEGVDRDPLGTPDSHVMTCTMQRVTQHATCHRNMQRVTQSCTHVLDTSRLGEALHPVGHVMSRLR